MSFDGDPTLVKRCAAWGRGAVVAFEPLATRGFSGAAVHLVQFAGSPDRFVLKPFPPSVSRDRAEWVHRLMRHAHNAGVTEVPDPLVAVDGGSLIPAPDGSLWELVRFVSGQPSAAPTPAAAAAALTVVGRMHNALTSLPGVTPDRGTSAGVERRIQQAGGLLRRPWSMRLAACGGAVAAREHRLLAACQDAERILASPLGGRGLAAVATAQIGPVRRQAVVRDLWSDHLLFDRATPARVAGIIDFHAAGFDTPVTDVARLLGSWQTAASDPAAGFVERWAEPLAAYEQTLSRPLTPRERWLAGWLHAATVICGLDNWFRWTLEENRQFADPNRVFARVSRLAADLPASLEWLSNAGSMPV